MGFVSYTKGASVKIIKVDIENYRKIRAFNCKLDGGNLLVAGQPDEGKTTAVSALWDLLESVQDPLRHGAKNGHITITLGYPGEEYQIIAERKFTPKTNTITISDNDGKKVERKTIVELLDKVSRDPLKVMELKGLELTRFLLSCCPLPGGFDIEMLDEDRCHRETQRLEARREYDFISKRVGVIAPEKTDRVDIRELDQKLAALRVLKGKRIEVDTELSGINKGLEVGKQKIESLVRELDSVRAAVNEECDLKAECLLDQGNVEAKIEDFGWDENELVTQLENASFINRKADEYESWLEGQGQVKEKKAELDDAEAKVRDIDKTKKEALEAAEYPIDGLSIEDGKVMFKGSLLEACGTEVQMQVSAALVASRIKGIKAMRIDRAESMGAGGRARLLKICKDLGVQVCMSRVTDGETAKGEIQIREGVYEDAVGK